MEIHVSHAYLCVCVCVVVEYACVVCRCMINVFVVVCRNNQRNLPLGWIHHNGSGRAPSTGSSKHLSIPGLWVIDFNSLVVRICPIELFIDPIPSQAICKMYESIQYSHLEISILKCLDEWYIDTALELP